MRSGANRCAASIEALDGRCLCSAAGWADAIDNPMMPFLPGMRWVYRGVKDGVVEKNRTVVMDQTRQIMGVTCTVVLDRVYENGKLTEKTHDWYAQDKLGNVWYFGEATAEYVNGKVDNREGSWEAGVNDARPGIVMQAAPQVGDSYKQELAAPVAEDEAEVLSLHTHTSSYFGTFHDLLKTQETSPLEPGTAEVKWYARGIGFIRSQTTAGPENEVLKLVSFVP